MWFRDSGFRAQKAQYPFSKEDTLKRCKGPSTNLGHIEGYSFVQEYTPNHIPGQKLDPLILKTAILDCTLVSRILEIN